MSDTTKPKQAAIQVVDENDTPIGGATKEEIHRDGLLHRIVRVMLKDKEGNFLIQKRQDDMSLFPNCWDNSAAGHVDEGEDYQTATYRELSEELGVNNVSLTEIAYYKTNGRDGNKLLNRFNKLYLSTVDHNIEIHLQEDEVADIKWMPPDEIKRLITKYPNDVTDGLKEISERLLS